VSALPADVQEAIENAESLTKVPADERWDALMKLDVEDQARAYTKYSDKQLINCPRTSAGTPS